MLKYARFIYVEGSAPDPVGEVPTLPQTTWSAREGMPPSIHEPFSATRLLDLRVSQTLRG